ncbi:MAG: PD40 domain-containing protein [Bacteroidales bacterium]|nr:PD40 domain-containing protein [Bacteroidales bacterium]
MKRLVLISALLCLTWLLKSQEEARLLRFPAVHGDMVVFTFAGDLYSVGLEGGVARKLTNDVGFEMFARFSPDGNQIAFTGQYDGNTEVYLIPSGGGIPERLTYTATLSRDDISDRMGPNNIVMGWKNDHEIIYRSRKNSFNPFKGRLYTVSTSGGLSDEFPLPCAGFCSFSPDRKKLAFNRVFREFRTWKYYRGGMVDDVWIYDFETRQTINITNNEAQDIIPMWHGDMIYFLSDRDRTMNLFAYNTLTGETEKLTHYTGYDIKFPSLGDHSIIYENGGFLYRFNLSDRQVSRIPVVIADDHSWSRNGIEDASHFIRSWALSPDGNRMVFGARGDVFSVPVRHGITRNLTNTSRVNERNVEWSPDGKYISFVSDQNGSDDIYVQQQDGMTEARCVVRLGDTYVYNPVWSPDNRKMLWSDKKQRLQYADVETGLPVMVDETRDGEFNEYVWSPDSRWIAYVKPEKEGMPRIWIYQLEGGVKRPVTDSWYASGSPVFSIDGKYLFFVSSRDFSPAYSWTEWNHIYRDMHKLFALTLEKSVENPLGPRNDEVNIKKDPGNEPPGQEGEKDNPLVGIDFDGIEGRIIALPVENGSYWNLQPAENRLYYCFRDASQEKASLKMFDLDDRSEKTIGEFGSFIISADRKKMAVSSGAQYAVIDIPASKVNLDKFVDLSGMKIMVDYREEWNQIFNEAWRLMRDFFYDPGMHGVDWHAVYEKYAALIPYVYHRDDLNYVIGEMIGELNAGHAYITGGDKPAPERISMGLLGAELSRDPEGTYRIDRILQGENWNDATRSPLTEVGVDVHEGDYILAVNGKSTTEMNDIYQSLFGMAGKQVELTVNNVPSLDGARRVTVIPARDESGLYYYNWVQDNIRKVEAATEGQVGYIHIPDMSSEGLNEFVKHYYPQLRKRALIIDNRGNGGGNVSPMIIERLAREITIMSVGRNGSPNTKPAGLQHGPKIMLIDNYSASDGDLFPYQFRKLGLGKLVGVRTWGGVVGYRSPIPFVDGGALIRPEFAHYDLQMKQFVIEGRGVEPDVWVDNDPAREYDGNDDQLNKAIELILEDLKNWPENWLEIPSYPEKNK